ncbi:radical SAM protein [Ancylomarina euxinus]|uniref:Radical SAM protein n=1 Tax=Ancylomarina euxinus TaxID=2283627 RepID=A0A425Y321_9BACT|nr:radical SAM protein [Ancylomarina euxinus]MCZ4693144.1 radical SAM protein [Ancylomarina euxinus]MUP15282.1 radical SAM protein [Ancylomarina euxinus]RRG22588.1 radical SAM protein [Ancylomarina euxinus]
MITYDEPLFRPPSEAYSLILQVSLGCAWNKCAFCEMYSNKQFRLRPEEEIFAEIDSLSSQADQIRKVFLADGNAMVMSFDKLSRLLDKLNATFPKLNRVSAYALPRDIESKTDEELRILTSKGLKLLYVGIESGDDKLLQVINKGEDFSSTSSALKKARQAGIKLSVMILNGLGGQKYSEQHAINSAKVVNEIQPEFLSTLVLSYPYGEDHFKQKFNDEFIPLNTIELIAEMKVFIETLELDNTVFRSDHASNYLILKGNLNRDKEELLDRINGVFDDPANAKLRPEWMRGL